MDLVTTRREWGGSWWHQASSCKATSLSKIITVFKLEKACLLRCRVACFLQQESLEKTGDLRFSALPGSIRYPHSKSFFFLAVLGLNCSMQVLLIAERGLGYTGSAVAVLGFPLVLHGLSCLAACGILVPRPWIEPTSPALEAGFLTTGPPGKFPIPSLNISFLLNGFTLTRKTALSCKAVNSVKFCILLSTRLALWL